MSSTNNLKKINRYLLQNRITKDTYDLVKILFKHCEDNKANFIIKQELIKTRKR